MLHNSELPTKTTLYSSVDSILCHCVRMIIYEKDINANKNFVDIENIPENILELNPYGMLPILSDRQMVLYDFSVIIEYLDERFPFPSLMSIDPIERAEKRLLLFRFTRAEDSLFSLANRIITPKSDKDRGLAKKMLINHLTDLTPLFENYRYFKSDEFSIIDICMAAILWRLKKMDIQLPDNARPIYKYASRLFARTKFKHSLSDVEREYN